MQPLLRQVEDLLDVAAGGDSAGAAIVLGRDGGFRMLDATGWSLPALREEFGARAVFKVERRGSRVRIEACDSDSRCLVERSVRSAGNPIDYGISRAIFAPSRALSAASNQQ